jgi:hypothetical protein
MQIAKPYMMTSVYYWKKDQFIIGKKKGNPRNKSAKKEGCLL